MNLYLLASGECLQLARPLKTDGVNAVLAIARNQPEALTLGRLFDTGRIQPDNQMWNGRPCVALKMSHTGWLI